MDSRRDRLLELVARLREASPGAVAPGDLAHDLRVGRDTLRKDLAELEAGGLPLRHDKGRGVVLEPLPPGEPMDEAASVAAPVPLTIAEAVRGQRVVRIVYVDVEGERTTRDVEAGGLVVAPYGEYLVGWCRLREGPRLFRLDRISAAVLTGAEAGLRPVDELLASLRVPAPRAAPDRSTPARARAWTLDRIRHVRLRLAETEAAVASSAEGAARLRAVLGHLAEWTRWQVAAVRSVSTGEELRFFGRRPAFPADFDREQAFEVRERMIQDAMAVRSFGELARDLDDVLDGAAHWVHDSPDAWWTDPVPDPATPGRHRPLADLVAGWHGPLFHVEWHLDRLAEPPEPEESADDDPDERLVLVCPLLG
ncbi:helix-turn-helix transcriptional regulator [Actinocorallia longicatena]|uniref:WYL domain-containing protein n=1 Tax=Actinocorallia longicatena TaxID=111803 RepID=A0ABP6PVB0_9ACTN